MNMAGRTIAAERSVTATAAILCLLLPGCVHSPSEVRRTAQEEVCIIGDTATSTDDSGFGCASAANLELMVAYPEHFQNPLELAPPQGDAAIAPARRYHFDQEKSLPEAPSAEVESR